MSTPIAFLNPGAQTAPLREELLRAVWSRTHVDETLLRGTMRDLRAALGDDADATTRETNREVDLRLIGREGGVADVDLARVDERLAIKAEVAPLCALSQKAGFVLDVVEDTIDDHLARGPSGQQRQRDRRTVG